MTPTEKLAAAKRHAEESRTQFDDERRYMEQIARERETVFNQQVRPRLRAATSRDYSCWLRGYLERGGRISNYYDYRMPSDFYVALRSSDLPLLYGSQAVHIIVPGGITVAFDALGHNGLFFMDGFDVAGGFVPAYSDTIVD